MNTLYERLGTEFAALLADLRPSAAYNRTSKVAGQLALEGFSRIRAEFGLSEAAAGELKRNQAVLADVHRGYQLYGSQNLEQALEVAFGAVRSAREAMDILSEMDAMHLTGRVLFDLGRHAEAGGCFANEMDLALASAVPGGFVRAVHEASRVRDAQNDLLGAEFGFRFAWVYYLGRMKLAGLEGLRDAPGCDLQNATAAKRSLLALSEKYIMFERGPRDADVLIERLASPHLSLRDASGAAFLEVRGLATLCLATIPKHQGVLARMAARAMRFNHDYPKISAFLLEEAEYVANLSGDAFPAALKKVLAEPAKARPLRSDPFYKPLPRAVAPSNSGAPFTTLETAAKDPSDLYRYLREADGNDRYVYRGQTKHYPGPLLPSAFRSIITEEYGRTRHARGDGLDERLLLRKTGSVFYGEYNSCFKRYADPVSHLVQGGAPPEKIQAAMSVYRRIYESSFAQGEAEYVPWVEELRQVLSPGEFEVFTENQVQWTTRINNYHRRVYRNERFVPLFGYTLGTTFAQQYGFSSEGLDATKSLDVAFFFATRDSADFNSVPHGGTGVIYRFPFPSNDIAASPLDKYDYYTLPSIVDVKDVIYRFEMKDLTMAESRTCLDAYVGARLIDGFQDPDLLILPDGFYETTRVSKQDAVIIFPDEIREDRPDREPGPEGIRFPKYRYIEDLLARDGVQAFYFQHTGEIPAGTAATTREVLWPRDDVLLELVVRIILADYRLRMNHPRRPDLIDVGFDNEEFARQSTLRYWADRPIFFTEYEKFGASFGALTL
jgi:hypothetical protein